MILTGVKQRLVSHRPFLPCTELRKSRATCQSRRCQCVRQPFCDEGGVGFVATIAENPTPLWSHHTILLSDETWLSEWSDGMGERSGGAVRSRGAFWGKQLNQELNRYPSFDMSYYKRKLFKSSKPSIKPLTACGPPSDVVKSWKMSFAV